MGASAITVIFSLAAPTEDHLVADLSRHQADAVSVNALTGRLDIDATASSGRKVKESRRDHRRGR
jgi:hypothetical protein